MTNDYMSSEESGEDDTIIIHRPQWRSDYVTAMFDRIDTYRTKTKSPQAIRQMKKRTIGPDSNHTQPCAAPSWAVHN